MEFVGKEAHEQSLSFASKVQKIVITGGPCSGKTTAMERLQVYLRERGFRVFVCPEAATILLLNGASFDDFGKEGCPYAFQQFVIRTQISFEDSFENYARVTGQPSIILCDRGVMDGSAYIDKPGWQRLLDEMNLNEISARDSRYNAVFHLVTAADGAAAHYSLENNKARSESLENAIEVDRRTQNAWHGHPQHFIIDNSNGKSFEKKLENLVDGISRFVGLPCLRRQTFKYKLSPFDVSVLPDNVQVFDVEKIMLLLPSSPVGYVPPEGGTALYRFIRKRTQGQFSAYGLTTVKRLESGEKIELKQVITGRMYDTLASTAADKERSVVRQIRYCFLWEQQSFHVYHYLAPNAGLWLLQCQSDGVPRLPPFLNAGPQIGEKDTALSAYSLSLIASQRSCDALNSLDAASPSSR